MKNYGKSAKEMLSPEEGMHIEKMGLTSLLFKQEGNTTL